MIDDLAQALILQLRNQSWSINFEPTFHDAPQYTREDLETLRVTVLPYMVQPAPMHKLGQKPTKSMRGIEEYLYTLDIAFQQVGPPRPQTGTDPIIAFSAARRTLVQEVMRWLNQPENKQPATYQQANRSAWIRTIEPMPLYDVTRLREERLFIGILRVTYEEYVRE